MISGYPIADLVGLALGLLATGAIAGIVAGLLGVGGGIVIVPVLVIVARVFGIPDDIDMLLVVGTSLATIIPTSISSARAHRAKGGVDVSILKAWLPAVILGALAGGLLSGVIGADGLTFVFGLVALVVAINLTRRETTVLAEAPPRKPLGASAIGFPVGFVSSLMGIGGGTLAVPILTMLSVPVHRAVGTASVFGLGIAVPAVIGFVWSGWGVTERPPGSLGFVNVPAAVAIFSLSVLTAPLGARIAYSLNPRPLKIAFALFLFVSALNMIYDVFS